MSTAKRSRRRQTDGRAASPLPASKRIKTTNDAHVPARQQPNFLVNEDARNGRKLQARLTNGVPSSKTTRVDESHAGVASDTTGQRASFNQVGGSPQDAIDISSGEESSEDGSDEDDKVGGMTERKLEAGKVNGHARAVDEDMESVEDAAAGAEDVDMREGVDEPQEQSFGEMLAARHPETIDVQASFPNPMADRQALVPTTGNRVLSAPTGTTLRTVLTQALKTNDKQMLEHCFQTTDLNDIRATIERLQSLHAATLLQRLAERIYRRPGRTGNLITWVQWSLVAHGAYLASQPEVMKKLRSLSQVLRERANGLQPLLHLKGKLDMLSAQLELRQRMQAASRAADAEDEEDEDGVVYVEGQDDDWSDSEEEGDAEVQGADSRMLDPPIIKSHTKPQMATPRTEASGSDSGESDDNMPNGVAQEAAEESSDDEEGEEMFAVEAEETDDDDSAEDGDSEEGESDAQPEDEDDFSDDESDDSGVQRPHPSTLNRRR